MSSGYIISYKNPDTDGVCSAIAYSYYLKLMGKNFRPVFSGNISHETKFVLNQANISLDFPSEYGADDQLIIVDTHHLSQLGNTLNPLNVVEILDHHPAGDDDVFLNATIDNRQIGAVATIVAEKIFSINAMSTQMAILLGSAIISNTMNFSAPSTSQYDIDMYAKLCLFYDFTEDYISKMFDSKNSILCLTYEEILTSDVKKFEIENQLIAIAQIELANIPKGSMGEIKKKHRYDYYIVSIINIALKRTYVMFCDDKSKYLINRIFNIECQKSVVEFSRILLRKTDFIPQIKEVLEEK